MDPKQHAILRYLAGQLSARTEDDARDFAQEVRSTRLPGRDMRRALQMLERQSVIWCDIFELCENVYGRCTSRNLDLLYQHLDDLGRRGLLRSYGFAEDADDPHLIFLFEFKKPIAQIAKLVQGGFRANRSPDPKAEQVLKKRGAMTTPRPKRDPVTEHILKSVWKRKGWKD